MNESVRVAFIHGRPAPHPIHTKIAKTLSADFFLVDRFFRWHDLNKNPLYRYFSWVFNATFFPYRKYDVLLAEGCHITPMIARKLHLIKKNQKVGALMANEVLYFIDSKKYSKETIDFNIKALKSYDFLMCIGEQQTKLARKILGADFPVFTIFNGVPEEKVNKLKPINPNLEHNHILFIGNGPDGWRTWYKGLDLMVKAFDMASSQAPDAGLKFTIVGDWTKQQQLELLKDISNPDLIRFVGLVDNIESYISEATIYLHTARGDSFPTTVLETMAAGLIPIISNEMGTTEIVKSLDPALVVDLDEKAMAAKMLEIAALSNEEKRKLSEKAKQLILENYREKDALANMKTKFLNFVR